MKTLSESPLRVAHSVYAPARNRLSASSHVKYFAWSIVLTIALLGHHAVAQTSCGTRHTKIGVFICYPNPTENAADSNTSDFFHFSAQANAPEGELIKRYTILIDDRTVYQSRLPAPLRRVSIEMNLKSPFDSGRHALRFVVRDIGSAEVTGLQFHLSTNAGFCDPFSRSDHRSCTTAKVARPLRWSITGSAFLTSTFEIARNPDPALDGYITYLKIYSRNLKSIEADASDAIATDTHGSLYIASHVFTDIELRKYSSDGGIIYDSLIRSCGDGFLGLTAIAVADSGLVWIAGNTTACFHATPNAFRSDHWQAGRMRGVVMLVDTARPSLAQPLYLTYLSETEYRITALRADGEGNAYVAGATSSIDFPHESLLDTGQGETLSDGKALAFVSVLNPSGSGLKWSTVLQHAKLTALSVDGTGNVYLTGRAASLSNALKSGGSARSALSATRGGCIQSKLEKACDNVLIVKLSDRGRRLSYVARLGGSGNGEGRAISTSPQNGSVFVAGVTAAPDFPGSSAGTTSRLGDQRSFVAALQLCVTGLFYSRVVPEVYIDAAPSVALVPALDAFASAFSGSFASTRTGVLARKPAVQIAPPCYAATL